MIKTHLLEKEEGNKEIGEEVYKAIGQEVNKEEKINVEFKVQLIAINKKMDKNDAWFKGLKVNEYQHKGMYKYTVGNYKTSDEAFACYIDVMNRGFSQAFIVAFNNGERIGIKDAMELLN
jgi:N-acetylmuramoyl-L-alanine amidase